MVSSKPGTSQPQAAPAPHHHRQFSDADFDSDINQQLRSSPPFLNRTTSQLNLSVLQRHDPSILQILSVAPFAVVYSFSPASQTWEKNGVEGTLFVVQLTPITSGLDPSLVRERYAVVVLNRRGLENLNIELTKEDHVEVTHECIIVHGHGPPDRTAAAAHPSHSHAQLDTVIYGLWVFTEPAPSSTIETRRITESVIQECAARAEESARTIRHETAPPQSHRTLSQPGSSNSTAGIHHHPPGQGDALLGLFSRARNDYYSHQVHS